MQEIRYSENQDGISRELIDRLVGQESPRLSRMFSSRRAAALRQPGQVEIRETRRIGRNDPCPCGSGLKFKRCCGRNLASDDSRVA